MQQDAATAHLNCDSPRDSVPNPAREIISLDPYTPQNYVLWKENNWNMKKGENTSLLFILSGIEKLD